MTALLALYMVKQLLLPGHAEHVIGLAGLRRLFEFRGPMSDQAFASLIYGWYGGLVYFTPLIGGWVADRWLGIKRTVILGALLHGGGPPRHVDGRDLPDRARLADRRLGVPQGKHLRAGRDTLPRERGIAAGAWFHHLFDCDQHRRCCRSARDRALSV